MTSQKTAVVCSTMLVVRHARCTSAQPTCLVTVKETSTCPGAWRSPRRQLTTFMQNSANTPQQFTQSLCVSSLFLSVCVTSCAHHDHDASGFPAGSPASCIVWENQGTAANECMNTCSCLPLSNQMLGKKRFFVCWNEASLWLWNKLANGPSITWWNCTGTIMAGQNRRLGEIPVPMPFRSLQIAHSLPWGRTRASEVKRQLLTTSAMTRPFIIWINTFTPTEIALTKHAFMKPKTKHQGIPTLITVFYNT